VFGGAGDDRVYGDAGDDKLAGQGGNDSIQGGSGDDTIIGGAGRDLVRGDGGEDLFQFNAIGESGDRILDFDRGEDHLGFRASGFAGLTANFGLVVGDDPTATKGVGTFLFDTGTEQLFYDADGSGAGAERFITRLDDVATLTRDDFLIT
jgi:Ca2+-binding RTX toxin-like protein